METERGWIQNTLTGQKQTFYQLGLRNGRKKEIESKGDFIIPDNRDCNATSEDRSITGRADLSLEDEFVVFVSSKC